MLAPAAVFQTFFGRRGGFDTDKRDLELLACSWEETSAVSIRLSAVATTSFLLFSPL